jgi:probable F420-dependent oxidoreductase
MLELARDRASGAYPYLVTPDYVASAREILGAEPQLAVLLDVVPETDPGRAREIVRGGSLRFLSTVPGYAANFRRMGFVDDDISGLSDRLVDALTVWGDFDTIARRITEYRTAGADQVVVQLEGLPNEWWGRLAEAVRGRRRSRGSSPVPPGRWRWWGGAASARIRSAPARRSR